MLIEQAMTTLFMEAQEQQLLAAQPDMIAVFLDDPTNADMREMRSLACLVQNVGRPVSSPLMSYAVERATYVRLAYTGPYAAMKSAYEDLLKYVEREVPYLSLFFRTNTLMTDSSVYGKIEATQSNMII